MANLVAPKEVFVSGIVTTISQENVKNQKAFRMVTLETPTGQETFPIGKKFFDKNADLLQPDANVIIKFQETIAGQTEYVDAAGAVQKHTSTGRAVANVSRRSSVASKMAALDSVVNNLVNKFEGNDTLISGLAGAYANLLR